MKKILITMTIAGFLVGGTVVVGLANNVQRAQQVSENPGAEATEQGMMGGYMMGQHMMSSQEMREHMMESQGRGMAQGPCYDEDVSNTMSHRMGMMSHMMGQNRMMGGTMSAMMDRMDNGPMGLFMMEQQPERDFYLDRVKELDLSADQVNKLKALRLECRKDNLRSASEATIARMELADLLNSDNWSLNDAENLMRKVQQMETDIQVRHLKAAVDARNVLTPQQLTKANAGDDLYKSGCNFS